MLRKKWISFLVAVSMVAAMLPTTAFAEGDAVQVESKTTVVEPATVENEQQNTEGETSEEEKSEGETPDEGEKSDDETSEEEKSEGEKSEGEVSEEEKSDDGKSEGEVSEEEKAEGETNEGETNEDKTPVETPVTPAPETTETTETPAANSIMLMNETGDEGGEGEAGEQYVVMVGDTGYSSFADAVNAFQENASVQLLADVELDSMLTINTQGLQLNLNGHTISASDAFTRNPDNNQNHLVDVTADGVTIANGTLKAGSSNNHTLNVWNAQNVKLNGLTLDNTATYGGTPLIVGASEVTLEGKVTAVVADNSWYAVNVDSRKVGEDAVGAKLTVNGELAFDSGALTQAKCGICIENNAGTSPDDVNDVVVEIPSTATLTTNSDKLPRSAFIAMHADNKFGAIVNEPAGRYPIAGAVAISGSQAGDRYYTDFVKAIADVEPYDHTIIWMLDNVELDAPIEIPQGADIIVSGFTNDSEGNGVKLKISLGDGVKTAFNNTDDLTNHTEGLKSGTKLQFNDVSFHGPVDGAKNGYAAIVSDDNVQLKFINCAFTDLYSALYCNAVMKDTETPSTITITGSSFTNVAYSYGVDDGATSGANADSYTFALENNENQPEPATFAVAVVDGKGYDDLQKAVDALSPDGGTIKLKKDVALTAPVEVPEGMDLTVEGNGKIITLPETGLISAFNNTTGLEGLKAGTSLTVNGVTFQGDYPTVNSGFAVVTGFEGGVTVKLDGCAFNDLYSAVYANPVTDTTAQDTNVTITNSTFEGVEYSYSLDNGATPGALTDKHVFNVDETNTGAPAPQTFAAASINGKGYNSFIDAVAAAQSGETVTLLSDVAIGETLVIDTDNIVLDLNGHTIAGMEDFSTTRGSRLVDVLANGVTIKNGTLQAGTDNKHTLNLYEAENVTLDGLTIDGSKAGIAGAPLVLGGSTAKLQGTTTVKTNKDKSWYGINVDSKKGEGSELTVNGKLIFDGENHNNVGIWVENKGGAKADDQKVTFGTGSSVQGNGVDGFKVIHIVKDNNEPQGTVTGAEDAGLITDKDGDYIVKPAPAPQPQQPAGGSSHKHNYTWQHSDDEHWQYCADCGQAISNGPHTLQWKDGYQECTVCGYRVGSSTAAAPAAQASAPAAAAPAAPAAPAAAAIPQTGDASNPLLWVVLLAVSGSALGALVYTKKKREE